MKGMPAWRLPLTIWIVAVVLHVVGDTWYSLVFGSSINIPIFILVFLSFSTVGALITAHYPRHPVGWIYTAIGLNFGLNNLLNAYADRALTNAAGWPGGVLALWFGWLWDINLMLLGTFLLLYFPTGRLPSARWKHVAGLTWLGIGFHLVAVAFTPGQMQDYAVDNPIGITSAKGVLSLADTIGLIVVAVCMLLSILSVVLRFRHSLQIERLQIKWFAFSASLLPIFVVLANIYSTRLNNYAFAAVIALLPTSTCLAILRYRLYDIDRIINKTLVYGSLTAILVGADVLLVIGLEHLLEPVASGSSLIVAGSTLAVAALVRPLRSRVQTTVDRRFYRHKYDAARTLEAFSLRLRDQTNMAALATELGSVVHETMQPTHVSLWFKEHRS